MEEYENATREERKKMYSKWEDDGRPEGSFAAYKNHVPDPEPEPEPEPKPKKITKAKHVHVHKEVIPEVIEEVVEEVVEEIVEEAIEEQKIKDLEKAEKVRKLQAELEALEE